MFKWLRDVVSVHVDTDQAKSMPTTSAGNVGRFEDSGLLIDFSATPGVIQRGPCMSGEHTREILHELGYSDEQVDELVAARTVVEMAG